MSTKHENTSGVSVLLSQECNFCVYICEIDKQNCVVSERLRPWIDLHMISLVPTCPKNRKNWGFL